MKFNCVKIVFVFIFIHHHHFIAQAIPFKNNVKWGFKEDEKITIPAIYDTVFNFDASEKICLACFRFKKPSANKFIKALTIQHFCNYLNKQNQRLIIKTDDGDTSSVFTFNKLTLEQYKDNSNYFTVAMGSKKYLIDKDFKQLTFKSYYNIKPSIDPQFYNVEIINENEITYAGLINHEEKEIVPHNFSRIKINPIDSLIYGCRAGLIDNYYDDVYDYNGNQLNRYHKHVELPTKNFIIHKTFEPKEHFSILNIKTKQEIPLKADDVFFYDKDQLLIKINEHWFIYDLLTNTKKEKQL